MAKRNEGQAIKKPLPIKLRTHQMTVYLEPEIHDHLRSLAYAERTKMHSLIMEGIEMMIKKRGLRARPRRS